MFSYILHSLSLFPLPLTPTDILSSAFSSYSAVLETIQMLKLLISARCKSSHSHLKAAWREWRMRVYVSFRPFTWLESWLYSPSVGCASITGLKRAGKQQHSMRNRDEWVSRIFALCARVRLCERWAAPPIYVTAQRSLAFLINCIHDKCF